MAVARSVCFTVAVIDPTFPIGARLADRYRIDRIGEAGATGQVYFGLDERAGRAIAIKVVRRRGDEALARRFLREARAVGGIRDPRVVRLLDLVTLPDGRPAIIMEHIQGRTLAARLAAGPVPLATVIDLLYEVLSGLAACHAVGVLHGDVKPENILLPGARQPGAPKAKLVDFGFAAVAGDLRPDEALAGSPEYMAPELWVNEPADGRTDQYAAGLLGYTLILGAPLIPRRASAVDMCREHLTVARPTELTTRAGEIVPLVLVDALRRATAPDRTERFRDVLAFRALLHEADPRNEDDNVEATVPTRPGFRPLTSTPPPEGGLIDWLHDEEPVASAEDTAVDTIVALDDEETTAN